MNLLVNSYGTPQLDFDLSRLTARELQVMKRVLLPAKNIAYELEISESTLNSHLVNIRNKTGLLDIKQLVYFSTKKGLIN